MDKELEQGEDLHIAKHILRDGNSIINTSTRDIQRIWRNGRYYLHTAIDKPGTILDPACGSAAMIYSLSAWSGHELVPNGVDINKEAIDLALQLYPDYPANFKLNSFLDQEDLPNCDYSYWAVFIDYDAVSPNLDRWILKLAPLTNRRLIISNYHDFTKSAWASVVSRVQELLGDNFYPAVEVYEHTKPEKNSAVYFDRK